MAADPYGDGAIAKDLNEAMKLATPLFADPAKLRARAHAALNTLATHPQIDSNSLASIGYCMGGRHVSCVAGAYPDRFIAGASLHGTMLISDRDDSPHRLAHRFRGELATCPLAVRRTRLTVPAYSGEPE